MPLAVETPLSHDQIAAAVKLALAEDLGVLGDLTTKASIASMGERNTAQVQGTILTREPAVLAGILVAREVWNQLDGSVQFTALAEDGQRLKAGDRIATIVGPATSILTGERTALNFLQQLSGVATSTHQFVEKIAGLPTKIVDTRKTFPGLRALQKYAVRCGGGSNHRAGLYDQFLFKDNHLALFGEAASIGTAIAWARKNHPLVPIEVEADRIDQVRAILPHAPDVLLLDNMSLEEMRACVELVKKQAPSIKLEASGNMNLERVRAVAEVGVDFISVGALTHTVRSIDLTLDVQAT